MSNHSQRGTLQVLVCALKRSTAATAVPPLSPLWEASPTLVQLPSSDKLWSNPGINSSSRLPSSLSSPPLPLPLPPPSPEIASLAAKCVSAVDIFDRSLADSQALEAAQLKFDDILSAPSLADACKKIDDLAARQQLDAPLMLLISKAWAAAKESNMMKEEVGRERGEIGMEDRREGGREGGAGVEGYPTGFPLRLALPFHCRALTLLLC